MGTCKSPHGIDCCTKPTTKYPNADYPCKDKEQAKFCAQYVNNSSMDAMNDTKCPVSWFSCDYDTGKCGPCDPRTDQHCMKMQKPTESSCSPGCIKIPKYNCVQQPFTPWKLPLSLDEDWSSSQTGNEGSITMWAEAAGPLGEGKYGTSPGLVQYFRGMAEFFCNQTLPCNRLQLRVENPYIDGAPDSTGVVTSATSQKNMYYPSVDSPIYTELLKNLDPKIVVQFMPWTHEPWLAFKNEAKSSSSYKGVIVEGNCATSNLPCYSDTTNSLYGKMPTCSGDTIVQKGDCYTISDGKCVDNLGNNTCSSSQTCAKKVGQKWPSCETLCCDKSTTSNPTVCDGGSICCGQDGDCPRVPALAVILADMWNTFLAKQTGYNGPFITGLAFDAEGSGYSASNLAKYSREAIHSINGGKDYYKLKINGKSQHFIVSVTQGSSFGGLIANTLGVDPGGNPQKDKNNFLAFSTPLPDDLAKIKTRLLDVLTTGVEGSAPAISDEALPEYYNVIDKCDGSPTLVDSLPNWKYPDFMATKACGPGFNPYVGEQPYLWSNGDTFACGDPTIVATGCSKESFTESFNCSNSPQGDSKFPCCGCGYSPSSIYLSAWNASDKGTDASSILWDGTKNDKVFKQANLPPGVGPLKHFVTGGMSSTNLAVSQFGVLRTCALLSIETSHGMGKADCMYPIFPGTTMESNCGIPNAFGTWTGQEGKLGFIDICGKVQQGPKVKINAPFGSVGVFSYPLLPNTWLGKSKYKPNNNDSDENGDVVIHKMKKWWKVLLIILLVLLILGLVFFFRKRYYRI